MFKTAVLGITGGLGVAQECIECGGAASPVDGEACRGFGPGCLGLRKKSSAASPEAADHDVRLSFRNIPRTKP